MPHARLNEGRARSVDGARERSRFKTSWLSIAVIAVFAGLMVVIPWEGLFGSHFGDRGVYLETFSTFHPQQAKSFSGSVVAFVVNEAAWDIAVRWSAAALRVPVEAVFNAIAFLCLFVFSKYLASKHGLVSLILLVNPLVIGFACSQLRLALAVSLLLLALFRRDRWIIGLGLISLACLVHTASFLFLLLYFTVNALLSRLSARKGSGTIYWIGLVGIALMIVMLIGPLRNVILSALGDRRADYHDVSEGMLYASFWVLLLFAYYGERKAFYEMEGNALAVACVAVFVCASLFNVYNQRFLAAAFPLIISSMLSLSGQKKALVLALFVLYAGAQWYFWMGLALP